MEHFPSHGKHQNCSTEIPALELVPSGAGPSLTQGCAIVSPQQSQPRTGVERFYGSQPKGSAPSQDGVSRAALNEHSIQQEQCEASGAKEGRLFK